MHIAVKSFGMKILKTWIYGTERVYSIHENLVGGGDFGPSSPDEVSAVQYFKLVPIDPDEVEREVSVSRIAAQIEQIEDSLIKLQTEETEKREKLSSLKRERDGFLCPDPASEARYI